MKTDTQAMILAVVVGGGGGYAAKHATEDERKGCEGFIQEARENERQNVRLDSIEQYLKKNNK